jgi:hypothetical protein
MELHSPTASVDPRTLSQQALDEHPVLYEKIAKSCDLPLQKVPEVVAEVMAFLSLIAKYNKKLTPSLVVDLAWHELILCTRYYHQLCIRYFGRFIHHHPGGNEKENEQQYQDTLALYNQEYGTPPEAYWGYNFKPQPGECGACESF